MLTVFVMSSQTDKSELIFRYTDLQKTTLSFIKFYADGFVVTYYMRISHKIKGIEGNRPQGQGKFAEIRRRSHWPSFLPTSSRFQSGFGGLPCSRTGRSKRGPLIIGDCALFYFFNFQPSQCGFPLTNVPDGRTDRKVNWALDKERWFFHDAQYADSPRIEGIEGNRPLRTGKIRRNPATIALTKFFSLRHSGFYQVSTGCHASNRVGTKGSRR